MILGLIRSVFCVVYVSLGACSRYIEDSDSQSMTIINDTDRQEFWGRRHVECPETLLEESKAHFRFRNCLNRSIRIARIRKSCNCAHVSLSLNGQSFQLSGNNTDILLTEGGQVVRRVEFIEIRKGDVGWLTVSLKMLKVESKQASVDLLTESGLNIGPLTVLGQRKYAAWCVESELDLGEIRQGCCIPLALTVRVARPEFLQGLRFRVVGYRMVAQFTWVGEDRKGWHCVLCGFVSVGEGRGYRTGRIELLGADDNHMRKPLMLRGRVRY
jgi:hypothetical protein